MFMKIITALSTPDAVKYGLTLMDDILQCLYSCSHVLHLCCPLLHLPSVIAFTTHMLVTTEPVSADDSKADLFLNLCKQRPDWPINRLVRTLTDGSTYISHRSSRILSILLLYVQPFYSASN